MLLLLTASLAMAPEPIKVLIVDGQNNHKWAVTTPLLKKWLTDSGRFTVDVATTEPKSTTGFAPKFADYGVVVSNYNGQAWPEGTRKAFADYLTNGGGFVCVHAADNAFRDWPEYNLAIGVGGWGGRTEKDGPYVRVKDGKQMNDETAGRGGSHGAQHEFVVKTIVPEHPIVKGLPTEWKHCQDELYDRLRGPAKNLTVLAYAHADKSKGGSGENEPMLMVIDFGKGRVFHTTLGHDEKGVNCVGFGVTFTRGAEWAATGKVTLPVPEKFPTAEKSLSR
jgi:uncharacterized protein